MVFLWNAERVLGEIFMLAKLHLSGLLEIPEKHIGVNVRVSDGKIHPAFQIEETAIGDLEQDQVKAAMTAVWDQLKPKLSERLASLNGYRRD